MALRPADRAASPSIFLAGLRRRPRLCAVSRRRRTVSPDLEGFDDARRRAHRGGHERALGGDAGQAPEPFVRNPFTGEPLVVMDSAVLVGERLRRRPPEDFARQPGGDPGLGPSDLTSYLICVAV